MKIKYAAAIASALVLFAAPVEFAMAAKDLGEIGRNAGDQFSGMSTGVRYGAIFLGLVFVVVGVIAIRNAQKTSQPMGPGIMGVIVGMILVSVVAFVEMGTTTLYGEDGTSELNELLQ